MQPWIKLERYMGMAKRWLEEEQARGYTTGNKSLICSRHLSDSYLNSYITKNGKHNACDYCDDNEEKKVITFDELMEVIVQGIYNHYSTLDNEGLPFISSEGGYFMHTTFDTYDLIRDAICLMQMTME